MLTTTTTGIKQSVHGFIIDTDHFNVPGLATVLPRAGRVYVKAQSSFSRHPDYALILTTTERVALAKIFFAEGGGYQFRLYDDDGELCYSGRCTTRDDDDAFFPLNWAMNDVGATRIDYFQSNGNWETL